MLFAQVPLESSSARDVAKVHGRLLALDAALDVLEKFCGDGVQGHGGRSWRPINVQCINAQFT
jgi:hypothetical protein